MRARTVTLLVILGAASPSRPEERGVSPLPVVPGAEHVSARANDFGPSVEFEVRDPYPALKTIDYLVQTLAARGWKIALPGTFGPPWRVGPPSVAESYRGVHVWEGSWRDTAGNEIAYRLLYVCPLEQHGMHSAILVASGQWYDRAEADRRKQAREREAERQREERCTDLRVRLPQLAAELCGK